MKGQNDKHREIQKSLNIESKGTPIHKDTYDYIDQIMDKVLRKTTIRHLSKSIKRAAILDYALHKLIYEIDTYEKDDQRYITSLSNDIRKHFLTALVSDGLSENELRKRLAQASENIDLSVVKKRKQKPRYILK